jgi:hypothetical protein
MKHRTFSHKILRTGQTPTLHKTCSLLRSTFAAVMPKLLPRLQPEVGGLRCSTTDQIISGGLDFPKMEGVPQRASISLSARSWHSFPDYAHQRVCVTEVPLHPMEYHIRLIQPLGSGLLPTALHGEKLQYVPPHTSHHNYAGGRNSGGTHPILVALSQPRPLPGGAFIASLDHPHVGINAEALFP